MGKETDAKKTTWKKMPRTQKNTDAFQTDKYQAPTKAVFKYIQARLEALGVRMRPFESGLIPGSVRFNIEVKSGRMAPLTPADYFYECWLWTYHHFPDDRFNFGIEVDPTIENPEEVLVLIEQVVEETLFPETKSTPIPGHSMQAFSVQDDSDSESESCSDTEDTIPYSVEEEMEPPVGLAFPGSPTGKMERSKCYDRVSAIQSPLPCEELDLVDELSLGPFSQDLSFPPPEILEDIDFATYPLFDLEKLLEV